MGDMVLTTKVGLKSWSMRDQDENNSRGQGKIPVGLGHKEGEAAGHDSLPPGGIKIGVAEHERY